MTERDRDIREIEAALGLLKSYDGRTVAWHSLRGAIDRLQANDYPTEARKDDR